MVPRTLGREMRKLGYFLPRAIGLFILSLIPVVNVVAAPLWLIFGVWMMAIQYIDYPADNNKMSWQDMLAWLREKRWQSLLWRHHLPGADDSAGERGDDAGGGRRCHLVLGARGSVR